MLHFKKTLAIIAALAGSGFIAPISSAQEVINIANTKGAQESTYFASVLGWKVVVGAINGQPVYCAAINNQAGSELRLGYGSGQWQVAVPYSSRRGEYVGRWDLDGKDKGTYGQSDGKWTFLWLNLGERDAIMKAKKMIIEVGKASLDYDLAGSSAAILKVEECVERRITTTATVPGDSSSQPKTPSGVFVKPYAKVEGWEIVRITKDAARKKFDHCAAWKITGTETGLRIAITANDTSFGFSGYGSAAIGNTAPVSVWFNGNKASAESLEGRLIADHNGFQWMMISERTGAPGLFDDLIPNANSVSFGYPVDAKNHVESFSLKSTKTVVARLINCRDGR